MKIKMVARSAGKMAAGITQAGFENGFTIQPRSSRVGYKTLKQNNMIHFSL
jgi:hypothetical protein